MKLARPLLIAPLCVLSLACSSRVGSPNGPGRLLEAGAGNSAPDDTAGAAGAPDSSIYADLTRLDVPVPSSGRVYVNLAEPNVVKPSKPESSKAWDLAFDGFDIYTNSGPSGSGNGAAFGLLGIITLLGDTAPMAPFLSPDKAGGAFLDWYAYANTSHALYSRYHVYGVKSGARLWKVQVLSYYAEQDNAPVGGLYKIRYAELGSKDGDIRDLLIDGTAGGVSGSSNAAGGCLDLATGSISKLTSAEARAAKTWDLCFRRDSISVNGEVGGPRGVTAVDLQADETSTELLTDVEKKTADGALPSFTAVSASSFADAQFRGDHVVSAFETGKWLVSNNSTPSPAFGAWLVLDAAGQQKFLVSFDTFANATTSSPGTIVMYIKPVKP